MTFTLPPNMAHYYDPKKMIEIDYEIAQRFNNWKPLLEISISE